MSLIETLSSSLAHIGFLQLGLAFTALAGYALAINGSLPGRSRAVALSCTLLCAAGFALLTPSWMGGLALTLMAVLVMAAFAAATWLLAAAFDLDTTPPAFRAVAADVPARASGLSRALARHASLGAS